MDIFLTLICITCLITLICVGYELSSTKARVIDTPLPRSVADGTVINPHQLRDFAPEPTQQWHQALKGCLEKYAVFGFYMTNEERDEFRKRLREREHVPRDGKACTISAHPMYRRCLGNTNKNNGITLPQVVILESLYPRHKCLDRFWEIVTADKRRYGLIRREQEPSIATIAKHLNESTGIEMDETQRARFRREIKQLCIRRWEVACELLNDNVEEEDDDAAENNNEFPTNGLDELMEAWTGCLTDLRQLVALFRVE